MVARPSLRRVTIVVVACLGFLVPLGTASGADAADTPSPSPSDTATPGQPAQQNQPDYSLPQLGAGGAQQGGAAQAAAAARARATGKAVVVGAFTTATSTVTAQPDGRLVGSSSVLPVRVRAKSGWVPVDTRLRRSATGRLAAAAVPGDTVSFSRGGSGAAAELSTPGARLDLWWPGPLQVPSVSGSSATYKDVLPGVDLVLSATSRESGGFQEVLVVSSRSAAADPRLASLALRVTTSGTQALRVMPGGALVARMSRGQGFFGAAAPVMWDSSSVRPGIAKATVRTAQDSARAVGAALAANGIGAVSTVTGPASGARLAAVTARMTAGGQKLTLVPDTQLLTSPSTRFPVYIDPGFQSFDHTGSELAYDPVQSDCPSSHFNSSSYQSSPVGYNDWRTDSCSFASTDYSLYRVAIPASPVGGPFAPHGVLMSASFQVTEVYTSDCSSTPTLTATWVNGISSSTGYPGPGPAAGNHDVSVPLGPDPGSCNTVADFGHTVSKGFDVSADLQAASGAPTSITFRVWEKNDTAKEHHKQLSLNPTLEVIWTDTPNVPSNLGEAANSSGAGSLDCASSASSAPRIGKTDSISGVYLGGTFNDVDGASVGVDIEFKVSTASSWTAPPGHEISDANGRSSWLLPASVTSGLADGTVMEWQAHTSTGTFTSGSTTYGPYNSNWSNPCYFAVYPTAPDAPALTPGFTATTAQPIGSSLQFTVAQSSGDTASEFIWRVDATPETVGAPATRTCSTTAATANCTKITGGSATLTIPVPSPGPHDLWVYEVDTGGNDSGMTNGAPGGQTWTFAGASDPADSYVGGTSLKANFTVALAAGKTYDNQGFSTQASLPGTANVDGNGSAYDEQELKAKGWNPGQAVTVDGATFTLPGFGTSGSGPDNLLSAGQVIGTGTSGAHGGALVFLAMSTHGNVAVPGTGTGADDSGALSGDATAPMVMAGYPVTGQSCGFEVGFNATASCIPASGTITYQSGCPVAQQSYTLTVPDWINGPQDIVALEMPDRDVPSGQQAKNPNIYAFAVPVNPSCTVASVSLPDVSAVVTAPALHILGMTFRDTTTATPEAGGATPASPSQQAWTGAFESPIDNVNAPPAGKTWGNQTVRIAVSPGASAVTGAKIRIRLSYPGFWSQYGPGPVSIGAATVAQQSSGATAVQAPTPLTFSNGSASATLPVGGDVYSDPLSLAFGVTAGQNLLVSLWLTNTSLPKLPLNDQPSGATSWFAPSSTPNQTGSTPGTPFTSGGGYSSATVPLLTGVDVTTPAGTVNGVPVPGAPTVVVTGDGGLIDSPAAAIPGDTQNSPSQRLAGQLASQADAPGFGVVDGSVPSNMIMKDGDLPSDAHPPGGLSLQGRLDHDVLAEPGLGTVIINMGHQDVLTADGNLTQMATVVNTLKSVGKQLIAFGVDSPGVVFGTLTACNGYTGSLGHPCDSAADAGRQWVSDQLGTLGGSCEADFDAAAMQPGSSPEALAAGNDAGDHANLSLGAGGGYAALATMESNACGASPPATPATPVP